jgi:hypothetical protein
VALAGATLPFLAIIEGAEEGGVAPRCAVSRALARAPQPPRLADSCSSMERIAGSFCVAGTADVAVGTDELVLTATNFFAYRKVKHHVVLECTLCGGVASAI